jgi:hypothetical protein
MRGSELDDVVPGVSDLSNAELDEKLDEAVRENERSEKLVCCFLSEVRAREAYRDFGFSSIYDYAMERFGFKERKTRYLLLLGRKVKELPELRAALQSGKLGWCKAARVASVAKREDETTWLDSALSLSVQELDRRIKDGTDRMAGMVQFWVTEDVRVLWENALETARRVAGVELSPAQAFEYMVAEFIATWGAGGESSQECNAKQVGEGSEPESREESAPVPGPGAAVSHDADDVGEADPAEPEKNPGPVFPFADPIELQDHVGDSAFQRRVLDRDQWKCTYPGCNARCELTVHHIIFRSQGGPDEMWNAITLCRFHHQLLHAGQIALKGRAPHELEWTPPRLMREVLARRRNRPARWVGELEVREFSTDELGAACVSA